MLRSALYNPPNLPCPEGRGPEVPVAEQVERQVHALIASTRQVLV